MAKSMVGSLYFQVALVSTDAVKKLTSDLRKAMANQRLTPAMNTTPMNRQLTSAFSSISRQAGASLGRSLATQGTKFTNNLKRGMLGAAGAFGVLLGSVVTKGYKRLTQIESAESSLAGLKFSTEEIAKIRDETLAAVKGTAYGLDEAISVAGTAIAAGIPILGENGKQGIQEYLKMIADVSTQTGSSMKEIGAIFNKVATNEVMFTLELNQLSDRGLPIRQWLRELYGVSGAELKKMVKEGKIDIHDLAKVMEDRLGGSALASGSTTVGALKNVNAAMGRLGATILSLPFPFIKVLAAEMIAFFDIVNERLSPMMAKLNETFGPQIEAKLSGLGERMATALMGEEGAVESPFLTMVENLKIAFQSAESVMKGFMETLKPLAPVFEQLGKIIAENPETLGKLIAYGMIFRTVFGGIGAIYNMVAPVFGIVKSIAGAFGGLKAAALTLLKVGTKFLPIIGIITTIGFLAWELYKNWDTVSEWFSGLGGRIKDWFSGAGDAISGWIDSVKEYFSGWGDWFTGGFNGLKTFFSEEIAQPISDAFTSIFDGLKETFEPLTSALSEFGSQFSEMISNGAKALETMGEGVSYIFGEAASAVSSWASSTGEKISTTLEPFTTWLSEAGSSVTSWMGTTATSIGSWASSVGSSIWNSFLQPIFSNISNTLSTFWTSLTSQIGSVITTIFSSVWGVLQGIFGVVQNAIMIAVQAIQGIFVFVVNIFSTIFTTINSFFIAITSGFTTFGEFWSTFTGALKEGLTGIFTGMAEQFSGIWENIKAGVSGIWESIVQMGKGVANTVIGVVNALIGGLNSAINGLNSMQVEVPSWVPGIGGNSWSFGIPNIPTVPSLSTGGLVTQSTLAIVGDTRAGEYVVDRGVLDSYLRASTSALESGGGKSGATPVFNIYQQPGQNSEELARQIDRQWNRWEATY